MTITAAPTVPNPNSATFAADAYPFTQWMAALGPEIDAETARINSIGFGAYSATSTTSLTVGTGSKSLTIEAGKSFAVGQPVVIASTAGPTNYMTGQVTSYNSGTGAMVVNATAIGGSGTVAAWTISIASIVTDGGVSPDSIVELTSGTSWTCPAGVTKVRLSMVGGGGGGGKSGAANATYCGGGGGGGVIAVFSVSPSTSYTYAIGGAGTGATVTGAGVAGGTSSFTANAITYTASGGAAGNIAVEIPPVGGPGSGTDAAVFTGVSGGSGGGANSLSASGGASIFGKSGGYGTTSSYNGGAGLAGKIVLELYK